MIVPNRTIKETICTSENIDQLSAFQENFFYRLIVNCDDFGRMDARPRVLASRLYPLKDLRDSQIESALRGLTTAELVILYEVDGKPFLQLKTWDRHQQKRAKFSKYPSPEDGEITASDSTCNQMKSDDIKCPRESRIENRESNIENRESTSEARVREDEDAKALFRAWEKAAAKLVSPMQAEELLVLLDEYGLDAMLNAIKAAVDHNAVHLAYVKAVLAGKGDKKRGAKDSAPAKYEDEVYARYRFT